MSRAQAGCRGYTRPSHPWPRAWAPFLRRNLTERSSRTRNEDADRAERRRERQKWRMEARERDQCSRETRVDSLSRALPRAFSNERMSCLVLLTLSLGYIISIKKSNQINIGPHGMRGNKSGATRAQTVSLSSVSVCKGVVWFGGPAFCIVGAGGPELL